MRALRPLRALPDDVKGNLVIGRTGKGYTTRIGFDLDRPMGRVDVRLVRRVHDFLPHRRHHIQSTGRSRTPCPPPAARRFRWKN